MKFPNLLLILIPCILFGQTYMEITDFGWGQGREWTRPAVADFDNDGLYDLLVGVESGIIQHYEQVEAASGQFSLVNRIFNDMTFEFRPVPVFTDLDGDELLDLIVCEKEGMIYRYEQQVQNPESFDLVKELTDIQVGEYPIPAFADLDNDGFLDMLIGEVNGMLHHYEQSSQGSDDFTLVTHEFGVIDVGALSAPAISDLDNDGLLDLLVAVNLGHIFHYKQTAPASNQFELVTEAFNNLDITSQPALTIVSIPGSEKKQVLFGEIGGHVLLYEQTHPDSTNLILLSENILPGIDIGSISSPGFTDLDNDGLLDMFVGENDGTLNYFEQESNGSLKFNLVAENFADIDVMNFSTPFFCDLDDDGLWDMLSNISNWGHICRYEQPEHNSINLQLVSETFSGSGIGGECSPVLVDLDRDGVSEMIAGTGHGKLHYYTQSNPDTLNFVLVDTMFNDIETSDSVHPAFTDLDHDGLWDMIIGENNGNLNHYEQSVDDPFTFVFITNNFQNLGPINRGKPVFVDINNDGLEDLVCGHDNGGIYLYLNTSETSVSNTTRHPDTFEILGNYPNPFNPYTHIEYNLQHSGKTSLLVYDIKGRKVRTLVEKHQQAGHYQIMWDGTNNSGAKVASGVYFCRLIIANQTVHHKMVLVK